MIFKQLRRLSKKEAFDLARLTKYLPKKDIKIIKKQIKSNQANITSKKLPISFLISGENVIPQIEPHNSRIKSIHFSKIRAEFSQRAYDVLPSFIAPHVVGLSIEKRAAAALLFSSDLKIVLIRYGKDIVNFINNFELSSSVSLASSPKECDFVFKPKQPRGSPLLINIPSDVEKANLEFIREYANIARKLGVFIPSDLDKLIEEFAGKRANSVRKLAKSLARMEMRSRVKNKDLARSFEIASASVKV